MFSFIQVLGLGRTTAAASAWMSQSSSPMEPALKPPPGVPSEFHDPYTLQSFQAVEIVECIILTTVMVAARLYTKKFIVKAMKWEDCTYL